MTEWAERTVQQTLALWIRPEIEKLGGASPAVPFGGGSDSIRSRCGSTKHPAKPPQGGSREPLRQGNPQP
jgi:hypothetical protein